MYNLSNKAKVLFDIYVYDIHDDALIFNMKKARVNHILTNFLGMSVNELRDAYIKHINNGMINI